MPHPRRLPLATVYNMRDLGGFAAAAGVTAFGRLWRSDLLGELPEGDVAAIERAGVRTVIDLRGDDERARVPNSLNGRPGITYVGLPLLGDVDTLAARMGMPLHDSFMHSLSILYSTMADSNPDCFVQVFEALLSGLVRGGVVFHCTAGKDRTGVIAMLLLDAAGVEEDTIIADYAATEGYMEGMFAVQRAMLDRMGVSYPESIFQSRPAFMRLALDHLRAQYGTALDYFRAIGLAEQTVKQLVSRLQG